MRSKRGSHYFTSITENGSGDMRVRINEGFSFVSIFHMRVHSLSDGSPGDYSWIAERDLQNQQSSYDEPNRKEPNRKRKAFSLVII